MNYSLDELIGILEEEMRHYGHLVSLIDEERDLLAAGRIREIEQITLGLAHVAEKVEFLEKRRAEVVAGLARQRQLPAETLSALIAATSEPQRSRLETLGAELRHLALTAETGNQYNALLIRESLDFIYETFRAAAEELGETATYGARGRLERSQTGAAVLDRTI